VTSTEDFIRYDVFDNFIVFKMTPPTQQHAAVTSEIAAMIVRALYQAELQCKDHTPTFALTKAIRPRGSGRIQDKNSQLHPDGQFGLANFKYPAVVIEVGWSQKWGGRAGLQEKLRKLLVVGKGETRVAIGVEMKESKGDLLLSLSLWRLLSGHGLDSIKVIHDRVRIVRDDVRVLCLTLNDFAHPHFFKDNFVGADLETAIHLPFGQIYHAAWMAFDVYRCELLEPEPFTPLTPTKSTPSLFAKSTPSKSHKYFDPSLFN
jgi:hypothetical protein